MESEVKKIRKEVWFSEDEISDMQKLADKDERSLKYWMERTLKYHVSRVKSVDSQNEVRKKAKR
jgi:hypothetical protein